MLWVSDQTKIKRRSLQIHTTASTISLHYKAKKAISLKVVRMYVYSDNKQCLLNMDLKFTFHIIMYIDICSLDLDKTLVFQVYFVLSAVIQKI